MSIDEVADLLGVSRGLVYQWCRKDLIPHYVLGFGRDGRKSKRYIPGERPACVSAFFFGVSTGILKTAQISRI